MAAVDSGHPFTSGMVTSWNKFCFTGGVVEVSVKVREFRRSDRPTGQASRPPQPHLLPAASGTALLLFGVRFLVADAQRSHFAALSVAAISYLVIPRADTGLPYG